jgi:predicted membrane metal-binding protein
MLGQVLWAAGVLGLLACMIVALRRHSVSLRTLVYWFGGIAIGVWIAHNIQPSTGAVYEQFGSNDREQQQGYSSQLLPDMDAIVKGEVVRVLKRDSASVRCLVHGMVDTRALPRCSNVQLVLTVGARTRQEAALLAALRSGVTLYTPATVHFPRAAELPTDFPEPQYCAALGAQMLGSASITRVGIVHERTTIFALAETAAAHIERRVFQLFPSASSAAFAIALVTGNTALLPHQTKREYALAGTAHLLAVSGLHVALVAAILLIPLHYLRSDTFGRRFAQWLVFVLAITLYVLVTGCAPSGVRAAVMAVLLRLAWVVERHRYYRAEYDGDGSNDDARNDVPNDARNNASNDNSLWLLNILAFSVVLMVLVDSTLVYAIGFQYSVAALAGIALLYERMHRWLWCTLGCSRLGVGGRVLAGSVAMTLASSSIVQVLVAWYFGTVSLIAPVANLPAVPLSSFAMVWSFAAVGCSWIPGIGSWAGETFAWAAHGCIVLMDAINSWCAHVGASMTSVPLVQSSESVTRLGVALWAWCLSCAVVYCACSRSLRQTLFRAGVSAVALLCVMVLYRYEAQHHARQHTAVILARSHVVAALVPTERTMVVLFQDRCPTSPYTVIRNDIALARLITETQNDKPLLLCVTGVHSLQAASTIVRHWYNSSPRAGDRSAANHLQCTVLVTSLQHKHTRQWQALDSLQRYAVPVVNASAALRESATQGDSVLTLLDRRDFDRRSEDHGVSVKWFIWQAALRLHKGANDTTVVLPTVLRSFVW